MSGEADKAGGQEAGGQEKDRPGENGRDRRAAGARGREAADARGREAADARGREAADARGREAADTRGQEAENARGPEQENASAAGAGDPNGALAGLKILDFSRVLAGPFATMMLADLGAEVLKIERPGVGDDTRAWGPPYDPQGRSTYFDAVNRNKVSCTVDLQTADGIRQAATLAERADVLVENFRPGLLDGLGLGYEQLKATNPALIYCSITGFGRTEQAAVLPGYDLLIQALGGLMSITGEPDGEPQKVGVALVDVLAGLFATVGILAAVNHRHTTGEGQLIEVDLLSSLLAALVNQASSYTAGGVVPRRMGNEHPSIAPYAVFPTEDGELVLAVGNDRQFQSLCMALGAPALADEPRFRTNPDRVANRGALRSELERLLAGKPAEYWTSRLVDARVPAGAVNDLEAAFNLAEAIGLQPIVDLPDPGGSSIRLPRNPIRLSATPPSYRLSPPNLAGGPARARRR